MKDIIFESVGKLDLAVWLLVVLFFCGSAVLFDGNIQMAFIGSGGIIFEMLLIGISIEIIIEVLKATKGIGTITGFITNGPEAVCLIVGLLVGDIIFAASTPLGSNFMNPLLLFCAAIICRQTALVFRTHRFYTILTILITATMALIFYTIHQQHYIIWLVVALILSTVLFFLRPGEPLPDPYGSLVIKSKFWLLPAIITLTLAGYFLDPVVSFAAEHSHAPKGVIGFIVLATLTSWPEFKSSLSLLKRGKTSAAILNITVSNITNIWLAVGGLFFFLLSLK
jgi:cation:H+ antiporter